MSKPRYQLLAGIPYLLSITKQSISKLTKLHQISQHEAASPDIPFFNYFFIIDLILAASMSNPEKRGPTSAEVKISPMAELTDGNLYPYYDFRTSGLTPYLNAVLKIVAPINPFAHRQIPTSDQAATGPRYGPRWYIPDTYPNKIYFDQTWPSHYNPFANPRRPPTPGILRATEAGDEFGFKVEQAPRFCARQVFNYNRCLNANDTNPEKCKDEQEDILAICPGFSLGTMRNNNLQKMKTEALNNKKYRDAMVLSEYNLGRTVANVPRKSWADGLKPHLRPDTLYSDDRYADVTQKEIDEARIRVKKRREARGDNFEAALKIPEYDRKYEETPKQASMYP